MIRKYCHTDLDELLDAWYSASKIAHHFLTDSFFEYERENIASVYIPAAETWVYERDGKVIGFIALIGNEIGGLFVHSNYQGKGIGRSLMDHAANLRDRLVLNVFEDNSIGLSFYEKYGFTRIAEVLHVTTEKNQYRMEMKPPISSPRLFYAVLNKGP